MDSSIGIPSDKKIIKAKRSINRRKHKNSRLGCTICKKRQIKCDETLPICNNCKRTGKPCSYIFLDNDELQKLIHEKEKNKFANDNDNDNDNDNNNNDLLNTGLLKKSMFNDNDDKSMSEEEENNDDNDLLNPVKNIPSTSITSDFINEYMRNTIHNDNKNKIFDDPKTPNLPILPDQPNHTPIMIEFFGAIDQTKKMIQKSSNDIVLSDTPFYDNDDSLFNAVNVNKKFDIIKELPIDPHYTVDKLAYALDCINNNELPLFFKKYGFCKLDQFIETTYKMYHQFVILFSTLMRKSIILFTTDVIKNILLKQTSIMKDLLSYDERLSICKSCEDISIEQLSQLTNLINDIYIHKYLDSSKALREIMLTGFLTLASSTSYHYNSGYRQSISIEQSNQCIKYISTFIAGLFSIMINENKQNPHYKIEVVKGFSRFILLEEKFIILENYNINLFVEIYTNLKSLDLIKEIKKNGNNKPDWSNIYTNLITFLEKHSQFLNVFKEDTLLGYDKGYIIRIINEWYQIFPHDLVNYSKIKYPYSKDNEIKIIIQLTFITLRHILQSIIPGNRTLVRNSFTGSQQMPYDDVSNLLKSYYYLKTENYKLYAIYLIRIITFHQTRYERMKRLLSKIYIPEFVDINNDYNVIERCKSLFTFWKKGSTFIEKQRDSMLLRYDTYLIEDNYATLNILIDDDDNNRDRDRGEAKIKYRTNAEIIKDFESNNNGLFLKDYDCRSIDIIKQTEEKIANAIKDAKGTGKNVLRYRLLRPTEDEGTGLVFRNCWNIENCIRSGRSEQ